MEEWIGKTIGKAEVMIAWTEQPLFNFNFLSSETYDLGLSAISYKSFSCFWVFKQRILRAFNVFFTIVVAIIIRFLI